MCKLKYCRHLHILHIEKSKWGGFEPLNPSRMISKREQCAGDLWSSRPKRLLQVKNVPIPENNSNNQQYSNMILSFRHSCIANMSIVNFINTIVEIFFLNFGKIQSESLENKLQDTSRIRSRGRLKMGQLSHKKDRSGRFKIQVPKMKKIKKTPDDVMAYLIYLYELR